MQAREAGDTCSPVMTQSPGQGWGHLPYGETTLGVSTGLSRGGTAAGAWWVYGRKPISDSEIHREIKRQAGPR